MVDDKIIKTILLVEDEPDVSTVISKILKKFSYNVITADSGETAVELALKNREIDLILMDIDLGAGIDGTESARRILEKIDIPIVFHTSHSGEEIAEKVRGITRYGHIIKSSGNFVLQSSLEMAFELFDAHKKIEKSEKLFRGLFNNSLNAIALIELIYNEQGKLTDGIVRALNPVFEKCTGLRSEDVVGRLYSEVYPEVLKTGNIKKLDELINKGEPYFSEAFYESAQKYFNFTAYEIDKGLVAIIMEDITSQILAKKSIIESEVQLRSFQFLHQITDNIPACVAYVNAASLRYEFVNQVYEDTFGISKELMKGMLVSEVIGQEAFNRALPFIERACAGERISFENMIPSHGELRCYNLNYIPQIDEHGIVQHLIILAIDINEHKLSEEKINRLLEEKEILIKEVHHRIKNNMSTIAGILFLQSNSMKDSTAVAALADAESRIHSMMVLYDKLYRSDNVREMSVLEYLPQLIDEIIFSFPAGRKVKIEKRLDDFIIKSNHLFPFGIIVNELITNIMKYAFPDSGSGIITVTSSPVNGRAVITIQDNGSGLPDGVDIKNSSGFGLHLVGILAEQIKGSIRIERDGGTKFILEFPL